MITCPNCGASFDIHEPRCPYCDHINPAGAEEHYMQELEQTRQELDRVDELAGDELHAQVKSDARRTVKRILIAAAVVLLLAGLFYWIENRPYARDYDLTEQELVWQREHFTEWDRLYEDGSYDEVIGQMNAAGEDHRIWDWQHYEFMSWYITYELIGSGEEELDAKGTSRTLAAGLIYDTFGYYFRDYDPEGRRGTLDEEELARLDGYRDEAVRVIRERMRFTDAQMEEFRDRIYDDYGVRSYDNCMKLADEYYKTFD